MSRKVINVLVSNNGLEIEYIDASSFNEEYKILFSTVAYLAKVRQGNKYIIAPMAKIMEAPNIDLLGVAIIPESKLITGSIITNVKEAIIDSLGEEAYNFLPRITEEEFYNTTE